MSAYLTIAPDKLVRLLGAPKAPVLLDVRADEDFAADPRLIPESLRRDADKAAAWGPDYAGRAAIVISGRGPARGPGVAALLRAASVADAFMEAIRWEVAVKLERYTHEG
jgi:hypothetical protein